MSNERDSSVGAVREPSSPGRIPRGATGISRITEAFAQAKAAGRAAFIPYITVGHPDRETVAAVVPALVAAGADIVELGVPFSDPLADGVVIQRSTQAALANGVTIDVCLADVRDLRHAGVTVPIVFLGYANPIAQKGEEAFAAACAAAGVDGVIVVDLPPEEAGDLRAACDKHGVAVIAMLAPTSTEKRIAQVAELADGLRLLRRSDGHHGRAGRPRHRPCGLSRPRPGEGLGADRGRVRHFAPGACRLYRRDGGRRGRRQCARPTTG